MNDAPGTHEQGVRLPYTRPELISIASSQAEVGKPSPAASEGFTPTIGTQIVGPS